MRNIKWMKALQQLQHSYLFIYTKIGTAQGFLPVPLLVIIRVNTVALLDEKLLHGTNTINADIIWSQFFL